MELRLLRYFLAVAREGSFTGAADYLHVTQPTLSRQIMDLEDELGQTLINRESRRLTLTPEGMLLRRRAEEIMELVQKTKAEFSAIRENVSGEVYIGGGESRAMELIADAVSDLLHDYPDIHVHIQTGVAKDVMERIDSGLLDFGVLLHPVDIAKYDGITLPVRDQWGVLMRKDNPLAAKKSLRPGDLRDEPLSSPRINLRAGSVENPFAKWFGRGFDKLRIVATHNLLHNASLLVERGAVSALTLMSSESIAHGDLCFRPLNPPLESASSVVWKRHQNFSKAAELFLNLLHRRFDAPTAG
ncbi:MAG: LysR family transcriptional regulator [Kiritimatiellia bacterium]